MTPPFFASAGGSSTIARFRRSIISGCFRIRSRAAAIFSGSVPAAGSDRSFLTSGNVASESASATRSRGPAFPYAIRAVIRSMSACLEKRLLSERRRVVSLTKNSTASSRASICATFVRGRVSWRRKSRLPIGVFVRSSTEKSVAPLLPARMHSCTSRLRRVTASSIMPCDEVRVKRPLT